MYRQDYILRMIEQATRALLKILGLIENKHYPLALVEIDLLYQEAWGLSLERIKHLPMVALFGLARFGDGYDLRKLLLLAELSEAEGDVYVAQTRGPESGVAYQRALEVLLNMANDMVDADLPKIAPRIAALGYKLKDIELRPEVGESLYGFYQRLEFGGGPATTDDE